MHEISPHEYGNRVGIFRISQVLSDLGIRATVAMDSIIASQYPYIVNHCLEQAWEVIGHGRSGSEMISELMSDDEERAYVESSLQAIGDATGHAPRGWSSVGYQESSRTIGLLAASGVSYVMDWANDEQPYWMRTPSGVVVSLPIAIHLDDVYAQVTRRVPVMRWEEMLVAWIDRLIEDAAESGRLMVVPINPWLSGQPFRIGYLRRALAHIASRTDVWLATGSEVSDWFATQSPSP